MGETSDALVVYGLITVNGLIGFYQELKALASLKALKSFTAIKARVLRKGKEIETDVSELVLGDLVYLSEGDVVPLDLRLIDERWILILSFLLGTLIVFRWFKGREMKTLGFLQ